MARPTKRKVLELLSRKRLLRLVQHFEVDADPTLSAEELVSRKRNIALAANLTAQDLGVVVASDKTPKAARLEPLLRARARSSSARSSRPTAGPTSRSPPTARRPRTPSARPSRLFVLNAERAAEEARLGLTTRGNKKKPGKQTPKNKDDGGQQSLL